MFYLKSEGGKGSMSRITTAGGDMPSYAIVAVACAQIIHPSPLQYFLLNLTIVKGFLSAELVHAVPGLQQRSTYNG